MERVFPLGSNTSTGRPRVPGGVAFSATDASSASDRPTMRPPNCRFAGYLLNVHPYLATLLERMLHTARAVSGESIGSGKVPRSRSAITRNPGLGRITRQARARSRSGDSGFDSAGSHWGRSGDTPQSPRPKAVWGPHRCPEGTLRRRARERL